MPRPRLSSLHALLVLRAPHARLLALALLAGSAVSSRALAQEAAPPGEGVAQEAAPAAEGGTTTSIEQEEAGRSRGGYAWGQDPTGEGQASGPAYHRYGHLFASVGAGGTVRIVAHADICDDRVPGREGCRYSPPYLQLRGGWLFEGDGEIQHGVGLGIATNLSPDGTAGIGIDAGSQWVLTPAYFFRYWFDQWFQLMAHFGVPLAITAVSGAAVQSTTDFNWALELQLGVVFKFLTGLGIYAAANVATWFAGDGMVWPTVSFEGGLMFDYEVLP